jgi:hypothetical protein
LCENKIHERSLSSSTFSQVHCCHHHRHRHHHTVISDKIIHYIVQWTNSLKKIQESLCNIMSFIFCCDWLLLNWQILIQAAHANFFFVPSSSLFSCLASNNEWHFLFLITAFHFSPYLTFSYFLMALGDKNLKWRKNFTY